MDNQYSVVITTTNSAEASEKIAKALLDKKLAACVQVSQIKSYYTWKDNMAIDDEQILLIKTKSVDYAEVEICIKENHSYEIPEIIKLPITDGLPAYLNWITEVTK
jgi:periplasmic divalent cation tolerance protein